MRTEQPRLGGAELENRDAAAGPQHRTSSRHATSGCNTLRIPNAIVAASTDSFVSGQGHRVAPHQLDRVARPRFRTFSRPCVSIAPAKSTPTTRAAPRRAPSRSQHPPCRYRRRAAARVPSTAATRSPAGANSDRGRRTGPCSGDRSGRRSRRTCPRSSRRFVRIGDARSRIADSTDIQRQPVVRKYRMPTHPLRSKARFTCERSFADTSDCS